MLKTPQCPGIVSGWLLSFLWPLAIVGLMLGVHAAVAGASDFSDGIIWGFAFLVLGVVISRPLHHLASFRLGAAQDLSREKLYGCPHCEHDIHDTPHHCPHCGARLRWGQVP